MERFSAIMEDFRSGMDAIAGASGKSLQEQRTYLVQRALVISIAIGTILGIIEIALSQVTGNRGIFMDGFVNILSIIPGALSIFSVKLGSRQADWKMHYGYRRIETVMVLLFALAVCGVALTQIAETLLNPTAVLAPLFGTLIAVYASAAITIEYLLSRYLWRVGHEQQSWLLVLDAILIRGDITISAIILAGGLLLVAFPEIPVIQTAIAIIIIGIIFAFGLKEAVTAIKELVDAGPSLEINRLIERITEENPEVIFISEQRIRTFGGALSVELTVEVDPFLSVKEAYGISTAIERQIREGVQNILEVRVRVHPAGAFAETLESPDGTLLR
ncbi:MAG: ferrous iron efflux protein F [Methanoregulaceae archaeon PtaB.Bin056]|jgi:cation diffusion facilitator family transporter|nr:MAG: ferrous iron efflux protein F [Methanoregulaceae archaeon PtaB.Bin056]